MSLACSSPRENDREKGLRSFYRGFGAQQGDDFDNIKSKYHEERLENHPAFDSSDDAAIRFELLRIAWQVIKDDLVNQAKALDDKETSEQGKRGKDLKRATTAASSGSRAGQGQSANTTNPAKSHGRQSARSALYELLTRHPKRSTKHDSRVQASPLPAQERVTKSHREEVEKLFYEAEIEFQNKVNDGLDDLAWLQPGPARREAMQGQAGATTNVAVKRQGLRSTTGADTKRESAKASRSTEAIKSLSSIVAGADENKEQLLEGEQEEQDDDNNDHDGEALVSQEADSPDEGIFEMEL